MTAIIDLQSLFLPQLNASRISLHRITSSYLFPECSIVADSSSVQPVALLCFFHFQFTSASYDVRCIQELLSRSLTPPYLSYTLFSSSGNMRATKPSVILSSLLPSAPKRTQKQVSRLISAPPTSPNVCFTSSVLSETDESGDSRLLLSVSRINKYFQCPYAFYLRYVSFFFRFNLGSEFTRPSNAISELWVIASWMFARLFHCIFFIFLVSFSFSTIQSYARVTLIALQNSQLKQISALY